MELWKYLKTVDKPIVLYGMGNGADRILDIMEQRGVKASGVFASDGFVRHQVFRGFEVCSYAELKQRFGQMVVLLAFGTHRPEVLAHILSIREEQELYAPDVPVAGDVLFDEAFLNAHYHDFEEIYSKLVDSQSKQVYKNVIRSKLTGDIQPLLDCESIPGEMWNVLRLGGDESYLDIGAYTGDTVHQFLQFSGGRYARIYAVEPDRHNYKKLLENVGALPRSECFPYCMDAVRGTRYFQMDGGRKSRVQGCGQEVAAETVDHMFSNKQVSLIKIDAEGMEGAILNGAAATIRRDRPAMQVAAYHRSEDLFALPHLVEQILPASKLYLRHFSCLPAWDTNFYFKF